jgi:hypothetical protein
MMSRLWKLRNAVRGMSLLLATVVLAGAVPAKSRPEIMGVMLGMNRADARARLSSVGTLDKEQRKRQEVWSVKDPRISHVLVGYDTDFRVRYVTAIARAGGPRIRYQDVGDVKSARRTDTQGNVKLTWEVSARHGQLGYMIIARGRDPQFLESYSLKRIDGEEID